MAVSPEPHGVGIFESQREALDSALVAAFPHPKHRPEIFVGG